MGSKPNRKLLFIALDGFRLDVFRDMLEEGLLPNIEGLVNSGAFLELLPTYPAITPASWTSMITGSWPGTHGLICFQLHFTGERLDVLHNAFQPEYVNAETLWECAERAGRRVVLVHFPGTRGARKLAVEKGIIIGGRVMGHYTVGEFGTLELAPTRIFTTRKVEADKRIMQIPTPSPSEDGMLKTRITFEVHGHTINYDVFIVSDDDGKYREAHIIDADGRCLARLSLNDWSDPISVKTGDHIGIFRFKLMELSEDGRRLTIIQTHVSPADGYTIPASLSAEITSKIGAFPERVELPLAPFREENERLIPSLGRTYIELGWQQADWLAKTSAYIAKKYGFDMLFTEWHEIDHTNHYVGGYIPIMDPSYKHLNRKNPYFDEERAERALEITREICRIGDSFVGEMLKLTDEDTIVVVASDHGIVPAHTQINVNKALMEAGLLAVKGEGSSLRIDWSRTEAYHWERNFISINLKGREPTGIVNPEDYWDTREEVISALNRLEDPKTGEKNIFMLFRREECQPLGLYGERIGDIFLLLKPGYTTWPRLTPKPEEEVFQKAIGGAHTFFHPTILENRGIFVISGPGVAEKGETKETIRAVDVASTLTHLLSILMPSQNQGSIYWSIIKE